MILETGVDPDAGTPRGRTQLTERQALALGLPEDPELLGCGMMACAYLSEDGQEAIKFTRDVQDARMSFIVLANPQPWAIRIRGVWRLSDGNYAIAADLADPIRTADPDLADAFDWLWRQAVDQRLTDAGWPNFRDVAQANIEDDVAEHGESEELAARLRALALADEAIAGFGNLGMGWLDFHGGNWGISRGRPVVIDLGLSIPIEAPPAQILSEAREWLPAL